MLSNTIQLQGLSNLAVDIKLQKQNMTIYFMAMYALLLESFKIVHTSLSLSLCTKLPKQMSTKLRSCMLVYWKNFELPE